MMCQLSMFVSSWCVQNSSGPVKRWLPLWGNGICNALFVAHSPFCMCTCVKEISSVSSIATTAYKWFEKRECHAVFYCFIIGLFLWLFSIFVFVSLLTPYFCNDRQIFWGCAQRQKRVKEKKKQSLGLISIYKITLKSLPVFSSVLFKRFIFFTLDAVGKQHYWNLTVIARRTLQ